MTALRAAMLVWGVALALGVIWQPSDPDAIDLMARLASPSLAHPLGTDGIGRDVLARVMAGGGRTLLVLVWVSAIGLVCGVALGTLAAAARGWREALLMRLAEAGFAVPTLVVALAVTAVFGLTPFTAGLALGVAQIGPYALFTHALARRVAAQPYVLAAMALGQGRVRLIARHVLPNILPAVLTRVGSQAGFVAAAYASLAFLGLGADPTKPDWGAMIYDYRVFLIEAPMLVIWPGLAIAVTTTLLSLAFDTDR